MVFPLTVTRVVTVEVAVEVTVMNKIYLTRRCCTAEAWVEACLEKQRDTPPLPDQAWKMEMFVGWLWYRRTMKMSAYRDHAARK
jgi:hypothetical protein